MKIIVFAHHLEVLNAIEDSLRELVVNYIRIDGSISNGNIRNDLIKKFQNDDEVVILFTKCNSQSTRIQN